MRFFGPNIKRLASSGDIDGLRAALRHPSWEVRLDAVTAIGELELPPGATDRADVVPKEAIVDLATSWQDLPADEAPTVCHYAIEAIARVGGRAAVDALETIIEQGNRAWRVSEVFPLLGVDQLIELMSDTSRPMELRVEAYVTLVSLSAPWTAAEAARASEPAAAFDRWHRQQVEDEQARQRWQRDAYVRFLQSSEPSADEAAQALVALYDRTNGNGFVTRSDEAEPVRSIGRRLHDQGGRELMLEAHARFAGQRPAMARNLEMVWDRIGDWLG
jgi:hypothetical protein